MKKTVTLAFVLALIVPSALAAGGKPEPKPARGTEEARGPATPLERAADAYNRGLELRDEAREHEEEARAAKTDRARERHEKRARKAYERAVASFRDALDADGAMHEAHSSLGYALRKLGLYDESLAAYDRALELEPSYAEAIEYRGEAYLGLGRIDDAKAAYMVLLRAGEDEAGMLLSAMQAWVDARRADGGADEATLEALEGWIASREEIAGQIGAEDAGPVGGW